MQTLKKAALAVWGALASTQARAPELALARLVLAGLAAKLGLDLDHYLR